MVGIEKNRPNTTRKKENKKLEKVAKHVYRYSFDF